MTKIVKKTGTELLSDSALNKGTAFSDDERKVFGLEGFLPIGVDNEEKQVMRVKGHLDMLQDDLQKFIYLAGLQDLMKLFTTIC